MKNTVQSLCNQRYNAIFSQLSRSQALVFPNLSQKNSSPRHSKVGCLGELVQVQDSHSAFCLSWQFVTSYGGLPLPHRTSYIALPHGFLQLPASKKDYYSFINSNFFEKWGKTDLGQFGSYMPIPKPTPIAAGLGTTVIQTCLLFTQSLWLGRRGSVKRWQHPLNLIVRNLGRSLS